MDKEFVRIILDLILIIVIFAVFIMFALFIATVSSDGGRCVLDPAKYYANLNNITNICDSCKYSIEYGIS